MEKKLSVGDQIIYSTKGGAGTVYVVGEVSALYPTKDDETKSYSPPDRVSVKVKRSSPKQTFLKEPIVYASNVVLFEG